MVMLVSNFVASSLKSGLTEGRFVEPTNSEPIQELKTLNFRATPNVAGIGAVTDDVLGALPVLGDLADGQVSSSR